MAEFPYYTGHSENLTVAASTALAHYFYLFLTYYIIVVVYFNNIDTSYLYYFVMVVVIFCIQAFHSPVLNQLSNSATIVLISWRKG